MAPEIVRPDGGDAAPDPSREVEFALMLSRVIDSVEKNPEFLRATVYELARHKLKEEFTSESFGDVRNLSKSLEVAIAGVEAFSKKKDGMEASLLGANPAQGKALISAHPSNQHVASALESVSPVFEAHVFGSGGAPARKKTLPIEDGSMVRCGFRNRACRHNSGRFTGTASKKGIHRRQSASANLRRKPIRPLQQNPHQRQWSQNLRSHRRPFQRPLASTRSATANSMNSTCCRAERPTRALPFRPSSRRIAVRRCRTDTSLSSSIVGIQRPMRPIGPRFGSLPGSSGKRTSTRMASRLLLLSMTIGLCEIFRCRIVRRRKRTIRKCTKSGVKIRTLHCRRAATRLCLKALPTISLLQVRSPIPGNAWSDWWQQMAGSIPNARSNC